MSRALFVTGTDTGVGKTVVAAALVRGLVSEGARVAVMKPVAAGAFSTPEGLRNADALTLMQAANVQAPYAWVNPYCFEPPIAPHIAAFEQGTSIDISLIQARYQSLAAKSDHVIIEGAGGWLAPISEHESIADVATAIGAPVVLVVALRLGCLNHALLTLRAIKAQGAALAGWIASMIDPQMPRRAENLASLESLMQQPPVAVVPHQTRAEKALELRAAVVALLNVRPVR